MRLPFPLPGSPPRQRDLTHMVHSAVHNPNVSDEAKHEAQEKLHEMEAGGGSSKDPAHVAGGLKS